MSQTPGEVLRLVERFERNREQYKSASYNETQVRREFIDPPHRRRLACIQDIASARDFSRVPIRWSGRIVHESDEPFCGRAAARRSAAACPSR